MPFTLAHPAAVLPVNRLLRRFSRNRLSLPFAALAIGSMAPDFPYFIPFLPYSSHSHELRGLFLFCLPFGLCAVWIFRSWIKPTLSLLLPDPLVVTLHTSGQPVDVHKVAASGLAILVGASTHIAWDSFTHFDGWAVLRFPALQTQVFSLGPISFPLYKLFQHGSSLLGLLLLSAAVLRYVLANRSQTSHQPAAGKFRFGSVFTRLVVGLLLVLPLLAATAAGALAASQAHGYQALTAFARQWVVMWLSAIGQLLVFLGIGIQLYEFRRSKSARQ